MSIEDCLLVNARITQERANIKTLKAELEQYGLYPMVQSTHIGGFSLDESAAHRIVGSILHDLYQALENIFKVIATRIDRSVPSGDQWHLELLEQMTLDVPGLRPHVLSPTTAHAVDQLRSFRHVFRNVYGFHLSSERLIELLKSLPHIMSSIEEDLDRFVTVIKADFQLEQNT